MVIKTASRIEITQQINFAAGRALIRKNDLSFDIIDQVASVLKANPKLKIVVEGHTDDGGPADRNLQLSDDRAHMVREALLERGVEGSRVEAIGYGESRPVASNNRPKGRAKNRRVEFMIVPQSEATQPSHP